jgi:hypothetical protein
VEQHIHWSDFQRQLEDVIEAVQNHRLTHIVTPGGQPLVVVIDYGPDQKEPPRESPKAPWAQADEDWFRAHYREIVNQYPNRWVAIKGEQVVAWHDQTEHRWVLVDPDAPVDIAQCLVEFAGGTRPL